jgi:hypothetical protein
VELDQDRLLEMSAAELDELFGTSGAGEVPTARGRGTVLFMPGTPVAGGVARLARLLAWQGKIFDADGHGLRNLISPFSVPSIRAAVYPERSWLDDRGCIVLDYSRTSTVAHWIRDEIREVAPGLYLGQVFWGRRRILRFALAFPEPAPGAAA